MRIYAHSSEGSIPMTPGKLMRLHKILPSTVAFAALAIATALIPQAQAANIITFGSGPNSCGGAVMCSTNGTTGYLNNGTGVAFDLSTINQWFQIDENGVNELTGTQTEAEPDGGAGGFLVVNNTGSTISSYSLTISDTFSQGLHRLLIAAEAPVRSAINSRPSSRMEPMATISLSL